jgi:hypothetical protein
MYITKFADRIPTGIRNTTAPRPAEVHRNNRISSVYEGPVANYDFRKQKANFEALSAVLAHIGDYFTFISSARYPAEEGHGINHRFDVLTAKGSMIWHKYVGNMNQSGQNHVFVAGIRVNLYQFLNLTLHEQLSLLGGPAIAKLAFPDYEDLHDNRWC